MRPRATVIILSHRPKFLPSAVASVLRQTMPVHLVVQHHPHAYPAKLNDAARIARGDWIVPLCDDDRLAPQYIERCLYFSGGADIVFTDRRVWWETWDWLNSHSWWRRWAPVALTYTMFPHAALPARQGESAALLNLTAEHFAFGSPLPMTCMIRRSLWDALGGYDDIPHADTEFWFRAVQAGARIVYVPEPLFLYRYHEGQNSVQRPMNGLAAVRFHQKHFATFGFAFEPHPTKPDELNCRIIPPDQRAEYAKRHGMKVA